MNTEQLVATLYARGARLAVENGQLMLSAPDGALDEALIALVRRQKPAIVALVDKLDTAYDAGPAPLKVERAASYASPASLAQQRMLFMEELAGASSYYNMPLAFAIDGPLNRAALARALTALLAAHDVLRTVYQRGSGDTGTDVPLQIVRAAAPCAVAQVELAGGADQDAALATMLEREAGHRFDLTRELPIRVALIALGPQRHVLSVNIHHIAADGHSARSLLADLGAAYRRYCGEPDAAAVLERGWQYADFSTWQSAALASAQFDAARRHWLTSLADAPELHSIMLDYPRPAVQAVAGSHLRLALEPALSDGVAALARKHGTTAYVIYLAAFAALLARYGNCDDLVFGTAAANRQPAQFRNTAGLFVNTLALRFKLDPATDFAALIEQAKSVSAAALRHQQLPFDALVDALQPARSLAYGPLVQIMLVMQEEEGMALELDGASVRAIEQWQAVSKFDFALHLRQRDGALTLDWEYNTSLFAPTTIARMSAHFSALLRACVDGDGGPVAAIALAPGADDVEADPVGEAGPPVCVHHLFEQCAARQPAAVALREGAAAMSYGELYRRAEQVARHLAKAGVGAGSPVGVYMEKSMAMVVAMLAIYKVGATYVPLDPHYPRQRLAFMLADAGVQVLLSEAAPFDGACAVPQLDIATLLATEEEAPYRACATPDLGAYIIYTSGSTGQPKGVLVTHANLYYALHANRAAMGIGPADLMPAIGSQAFGVSLLEIMLPLSSGGAVQLLSKAQVVDVEALVRSTAEVTVLHAVPSLMRQWLDAIDAHGPGAPDPYRRLRLLLVGGESVPASLLKRIKQWRPDIRLLALYGMTESTIVCASYEATLAEGATAARYCIGRPYRHARFHVLNGAGQEQPVGVPGELAIGGLSIAAGYVGQPQLTAERFAVSALHAGERLYRSGDRVRRLDDGNFEFLGRVDHQVSLRGVRIEMGEIETLANAVPGVGQSVAHVPLEEGALVLYYSSAAPLAAQPGIVAALRAELAQRLPDYMRPSIVERLDAFPLNPNGKVDRKKLPAPRPVDTMQVAENQIERRLLALSHALLERDDFGVTANFFEIGGHSLLAARLATRIRAEFGIAFPLTALFSTPTIRACAAVVEAGLKEKYAASLVRQVDADASFDEEITL